MKYNMVPVKLLNSRQGGADNTHRVLQTIGNCCILCNALFITDIVTFIDTKESKYINDIWNSPQHYNTPAFLYNYPH